MQRFTNINGKLLKAEEAGIPVGDRSFRYGYGLFETMLVLDGTIRNEAAHWDRLSAGLQTLRFELPVRFIDHLREQCLRTISRNGAVPAMRLRLQVTAGSGGYFDATDWKPFFVVECWPLTDYSSDLNENGLVLGIAEARKEPGPYSALKTTNALCYAIAAREARAAGWNDALLCNAAGNIVESCISNVFVLHEARVLTPPLSEGCVAGVMRNLLICKFREAGIPVIEEAISPFMLSAVEGIFLTNSMKAVRWIQSIDNLRFTPDFARRALSLIA